MQLWCFWGKYSLPSPCTCANPLRFGSPRGCGLQHIRSSPALLPLSHCSLFSRELLTIYLDTQTSLFFFFPVNKQNFYFMETTMHSKGGMSRSTWVLVVVSFAVLWIFFIIVSVSLKNVGTKPKASLLACTAARSGCELNKQAICDDTECYYMPNGCGGKDLLQLFIADLATSFWFPCYFVNQFWFQWNQLFVTKHSQERDS